MANTLFIHKLPLQTVCGLRRNTDTIDRNHVPGGAIILVALDEYFHHKGTKTRSRCCTTSISPGFQNRPLLIDHCSLIIKRSADAYGNTLMFIEPGSDGRWFTDDDVQSSYGANEIIFCGYRFDPETQLYYVRNRTYNPVLGRWIQRDPIGYAGGINLLEYAESAPSARMDSQGQDSWGFGIPAGSNLYGYSMMQQYQELENEAERKADRQALCELRKCAADAAKLALTLTALALDIYEAIDSFGASAIVAAPLMAADLSEANAELGELSRDGCAPSYADLTYRAKSLIGWANDLMTRPSAPK